MNNFKKELNRRCDIEFLRIKSKYRSRINQEVTLESLSDNLKIYQKIILETMDKSTEIANKLYPEMGVSKKQAASEVQSLIGKYIVDMKNKSEA